MRKSPQSHIVFSGDKIVAINTGSDFCSEHENGIVSIMKELCINPDSKKYDVLNAAILLKKKGLSFIKKNFSFDKSGDFFELINSVNLKDFLEKENFKYSNFLDEKIIKPNPNPNCFNFSLLKDGKEAVMYFSWHNIDFEKITFNEYKNNPNHDNNIVCLWDDKSFVIKVRTNEYVNALKDFYQSIVDGNGIFAGTLFDRNDFSGITIADKTLFSSVEHKAIETQQKKYEKNVRLKVVDQSLYLKDKMHKVSGVNNYLRLIHFHPVFNENESSVSYSLNVLSSSVNAKSGIYTVKELMDWAESKFSYCLSKK